MFQHIESLDRFRQTVEHKKEILWFQPKNDITCACYIVQDKDTFDSPESLECRGIAFNHSNGAVISRPLHKFFNVGERGYTIDHLLQHNPSDIAGVYPKLDGSLIATICRHPTTMFRSKKSFNGDHVNMAHEIVENSKHEIRYEDFLRYLEQINATAIFELIHPSNRIVVDYGTKPGLVLLHVRDNVTGEYLLLDPKHELHNEISFCNIPRVRPIAISNMKSLVDNLATLENAEGYVIQFKNGDMVKLKCPWYLKMHKAISMLRERDIAELILTEQIDDSKECLVQLGISLDQIHKIENQIKRDILEILGTVELIHSNDHLLSRKEFAVKHTGHEYFSLLMKKYGGAPIDYNQWYLKNKLEKNFSLNVILKNPDKSD